MIYFRRQVQKNVDISFNSNMVSSVNNPLKHDAELKVMLEKVRQNELLVLASLFNLLILDY